MTGPIFDTHAHYYDGAFDPDRDELLAALPSMGVALVVCPGCDLESSRQSIALAERYGVPCQVSLEERMGCGVGA